MRNFVPALEESLMKFTPADINRDQPDAKYKAHGGWFGIESFQLNSEEDHKKHSPTSAKRSKRG